MIQLRRRTHPTIGADLTPMIDCVFQLLVFFLLSSTFLTPALPLELPQAKGQGAAAPAAEIVVSLDKQNRLFVNRQQCELPELKGLLTAEFDKTHRHEVVFRADATVQYGEVLKVLAELRDAGARPIQLAYEEMSRTND